MLADDDLWRPLSQAGWNVHLRIQELVEAFVQLPMPQRLGQHFAEFVNFSHFYSTG